MPESYGTGLVLLAGSAAFAAFFILNMKAGATVWSRTPLMKRDSNPVGFWLIQGLYVFVSIGCLVGAFSVLTGLTPP